METPSKSEEATHVLNRKEKRIIKKIMKVIGIIVLSLILIGIGLFVYASNNTQSVISILQKVMYPAQELPINSFEPRKKMAETLKENGLFVINDLNYSSEYPNGFLDITYPDNQLTVKRPTIVNFHGGGYFGGSKTMGDPLAESSKNSNYFYDELSRQGYNVVNVDYALVPDYHFPVPLIQMNQAFEFLLNNQNKYHLDMDNVIIMGSSAGAIMTAQYGSLLSNEEYSTMLGIKPVLSLEQVSGLIMDDAPLIYDKFDMFTKFLVGNYLNESIYIKDEQEKKYNPIPFATSTYPASFLIASDGYHEHMKSLSEVLTSKGVANEFFYPADENGTSSVHTFTMNLLRDENAKIVFERIKLFLSRQTEK